MKDRETKRTDTGVTDRCVRPVPCTVMRGGTSRAVFFRRKDLPTDPAERDRTILSVMGSPHPRQIDGIGGAEILTSKIAIVSPSAETGVDVSYTFGQVGIDEPSIDYSVSCGNISSAVGCYAIHEGLVEPVEPTTTVRIRNCNSSLLVTNELPVERGAPQVSGECSIRGVSGTGARVDVGFVDPGGETTGHGVLPTGSPRDELSVGDRHIEYSYVDAGNPCVFVRATDLGCDGTELPDSIDTDDELLHTVEAIQTRLAVRSGLAPNHQTARENTLLPFVVLVAEPTDYRDYEGMQVDATELSLLGRLIADRTLHKAFAGTGAVCTAVASHIDDTIVSETTRRVEATTGRSRMTIGHPSGTMDTLLETEHGSLKQVLFPRTARRLLSGVAYARPELVPVPA